jgi:hypothetical protein
MILSVALTVPPLLLAEDGGPPPFAGYGPRPEPNADNLAALRPFADSLYHEFAG